MVLRNVPSTATFEEQRVEINELAADVEALDAAALKAESDTLQTVTGRGFTTTNPIKIENNAATAFVVEDGSSNEKFVVDSVNGKINVGSSAGGASGIYLFHNNAGATPAITLDGATGSITNKGQLVTESILSSAALNNKGSVQFGTVDAYSIGHMPLNSNLAFSQTHGGSYLFYSDASTVELEIADGGVKVDGILESSLLVNTNNTPTAGEGIEMFYDSAASGGAAGGIQAYDRDGAALTRLKIKSSNWQIENDGSATFAGTITHDFNSNFQKGIRLTDNGGHSMLDVNGTGANATALAVYDGTGGGAYKVKIKHDGSAEFAGPQTLATPSSPATNGYTSHINNTEASTAACYSANNHNADGINFLGVDGSNSNAITCKIKNDGSATFAGSLQANSVNLQSSSTNSWFQTGTSLASTNYVWAAKDSSNNVWHSGLQTDGDLYLGGNLTGSNNIELSGSDGTGWFQNPSGDTTLSLGDLSNNNGRLVLTAKTSSLEIHSRSNHPINFLFNTVTKATLGIGGDLSLAGGITLTGQTNTTASGASATSDAFDHYEEGTWTPNFNGLSSAFNSYSNKFGTYVRIGSWCHIQGFIQLTGQPSFTNGNAYLMLGPLPFNYSNQNTGYNVTVGNVACQGFNWHDNDYSNTGQVACGIGNDSGTSYVIFQVSGNDNVRGIVQNSAIGADDVIEFTLSYRV